MKLVKRVTNTNSVITPTQDGPHTCLLFQIHVRGVENIISTVRVHARWRNVRMVCCRHLHLSLGVAACICVRYSNQHYACESCIDIDRFHFGPSSITLQRCCHWAVKALKREHRNMLGS